MRRLSVIVGMALAACPSLGYGEDWPQFRGPEGTGVAKQALPTSWGQDSNVRWKIKVPGVAWSAPIISGDKVFVTTAITDNQQKPGGFGGGGQGRGPGGPGGGGGPGGPGGPGGGRGRGPGGPGGGFGGFTPPKPGEILPSFLAQRLELTDPQKQSLEELQKKVDNEIAALLTEEQVKEFQAPGGGGPGGFRMPTPGQIIPQARQDELNLSEDQKVKLTKLQKEVDEGLASLLTENQKQQMQNMRPGRGGPGGPGGPGVFGGFGNQRPPDVTYRWEVHCIDRKTGETLWKQVALESKPRIPIQESNTYATETPVTDGQRVYAYFGMHGVYCYDLDGKLIWKKDLGSFPMMGGWGTSSSPVLDGDKLFVLCDNEEKSFLVALDTKTGDELWRVPRTERTTYASPFVWHNKERTEIVVLGSPKMRSYDPATGNVLWELTVGNGRSSASPVGDAEMLYAGLDTGGGGGDSNGGSEGGLFAVKAGASGDLDSDTGKGGVAWNSRQNAPVLASPLLYDGYIYIVKRDGGIVICLDANTGKQVYRKRLPEAKAFWSSPWAGGGNVYFLDDGGTTHVLKAGPEFELLSQNKLDEMIWASTAAADGEIYVRSVDHLYCITK